MTKIKGKLQSGFSQEITVMPELSEDNHKLATTLSKDLFECGFSTAGPSCLNYPNRIRQSYIAKIAGNPAYIVHQAANPRGVLAVFYLERNGHHENEIVPTEASYFLPLRPKTDEETFDEYLGNPEAAVALLHFALVQDSFQEAIRRTEDPQNLRTQYHGIRTSLNLSMSRITPSRRGEFKQRIAENFTNHQDLLINATDPGYQFKLLEYVEVKLLSSAQFVELCEALLNTDHEALRQYATVYVFNADPTRTELKPVVLTALNHQKSRARKTAIKGLAQIPLTPGEENQVLEKIDDDDSDVGLAAFRAGYTFTLDDSNVSTLGDLQKSNKWKARRSVAVLLGKIPGTEVSTMLIQAMTDSDSDVREQVFQVLKARTLSQEDIAELSIMTDSMNWKIRSRAAFLLGRIPGIEVEEIIIGMISDDDHDVRNNVNKVLRERTLTDAHVNFLVPHLKNSNWIIRKIGYTWLSTIEADRVTRLLIAGLKDTDSDVRKTVVTALNKLTLSDKFIVDLTPICQESSWKVRQLGVHFTGKIPGSQATGLLVSRIKDTDSDVSRLAIKLLMNRSVVEEEHVSALKEMLNDTQWTTRKSAATILGRIKSDESLAALRSRLAVESDRDVMRAINQAITSITS